MEFLKDAVEPVHLEPCDGSGSGPPRVVFSLPPPACLSATDENDVVVRALPTSWPATLAFKQIDGSCRRSLMPEGGLFTAVKPKLQSVLRNLLRYYLYGTV